jgi:hypothetical protein
MLLLLLPSVAGAAGLASIGWIATAFLFQRTPLGTAFE